MTLVTEDIGSEGRQSHNERRDNGVKGGECGEEGDYADGFQLRNDRIECD